MMKGDFYGTGANCEDRLRAASHRRPGRPRYGGNALRRHPSSAGLARHGARLCSRRGGHAASLRYFTVGLPSLAAWGLLLFIIAALGGIYLNLNYHMKQQPLPIGIMIVHATIAVVGFVLLVVAIIA